MKAPVIYVPNAYSPDLFEALDREIPWEQRDSTPRRESWMSALGEDYTYGSGAGVRTYKANILPPLIATFICDFVRSRDIIFDACFANRYEDHRQHLGWHADDSPEMDDARPIGIVSFGAAREIWFKPNSGSHEDVEKLLLEPGSLVLMPPGMQDTHQHRIPKHSAPCGPRISLTFRGLVR